MWGGQSCPQPALLRSLWARRGYSWLFGAFAAVALVVAGVALLANLRALRFE